MIDTSQYQYCWESVKVNLTNEETLTCFTAALATGSTLGWLQAIYTDKYNNQYPTLSSGIVDSCHGHLFPECPDWVVSSDQGNNYYKDIEVVNE